MLSKIGGVTYGVAKSITPIMTTFNYDNYVSENFLDGLSMIYDDVITRNKPENSILSMSLNFVLDGNQASDSKQVSNAFIQRMGFFLQQLINTGVVVVTGKLYDKDHKRMLSDILQCSGNRGVPVNGYPAMFGDSTNNPYIPELIVVGAVDNFGVESPFSDTANYVRKV